AGDDHDYILALVDSLMKIYDLLALDAPEGSFIRRMPKGMIWPEEVSCKIGADRRLRIVFQGLGCVHALRQRFMHLRFGKRRIEDCVRQQIQAAVEIFLQ